MKFHIDEATFELWWRYMKRRQHVQFHPEYGTDLEKRYQFDGVMQQFKFMNIWRQDDRLTRNETAWLDEYEHLPFTRKVQFIIAMRMFLSLYLADNCVNGDECTATDLLGDAIQAPFTGKELIDKMLMSEIHLRIWNLADPIVESKLKVAIEAGPDFFYEWLIDYFSEDVISRFRPYEIITSMTYLEGCAWDEHDFLYVGHGAFPALQLMYPDGLGAGLEFDQMPQTELRIFLKHFTRKTEAFLQAKAHAGEWKWHNPAGQGRFWSPRTAEDSLCEFRKWNNLWTGKPQRRRPYKPLVDLGFVQNSPE